MQQSITKQPVLKHLAFKRLTVHMALLLLGAASGLAQADTKVRTSSFEYDASGLLIKEIIEPDSPNDCLQTSYSYDSYGNKSAVSTAACAGASGYAIASAITARTAASSYGTDGRFPVSTSNALSQSETKVYDARFGGVTSLTGPNGLTTLWEYDSFGRKSKETRADNTYTSWAYKLCTESGTNCPSPIAGAVSQWVAIEQSYGANAVASAPEKRSYYDTLGRIVRSQTQGFDGSGAAPTIVQDTEYDALGRVARKSNAYALTGGTPYWASYTYDVLGRVTQQQSPDPDAPGGVAILTTSYSGLTTVVTNSKGQSKTTTKNAQGQVAQVIDAQSNSVSYSYDALGQLVQTNAAGVLTSMTYNQRGQKVSMIDPAMGAWVYQYNVFGELVAQRDSLSQTVTMAYDSLGRMTQRTEADLISQWSYDKKFDNSACGKGIGKLCEAVADNGYKRVHTYDTLGRPSSTATVLDNPTVPAVVSVAYEANTGRMASKTWPTGYQASYSYSPTGFLKAVTGGGTNGFSQTVTYQILAMDAQSRVTQYKQGSQVTTVKTFNAATGRLTGQTATADGQGTGNVLNQAYSYDSLGNLTSRQDNAPGVGTQENFTYDSLNRLSLSTLLGGAISPPTSTEVLYDARGNITYKSDTGRYWYDPARPNRMTQVTLETAPGAQIAYTGTRQLSYAFDDYKTTAQNINGTALGNGNLEYTVSYDATNSRHTYRSESYTSYNMPSAMTFGSISGSTIGQGTAGPVERSLAFVYGPEHQRIKQTVVGGPTPGTTWYLNGEDSQGLTYEKETSAGGLIEHKHYASAGGVVFALFVQRTGNLGTQTAAATRYFHHDHLGSVAVVTNEAGTVIERMAFDAWGKRRFVNGTTDSLDAITGQTTDRGYTMHEHLDEMGVIHMNGRIYDPLIGRFMSADPFIQDDANLQAYNRFIYVMNNPLAFTDPSGYFSLKSLFKVAVVVAVGYFTGGLASSAYLNGVLAGSTFTIGGSVGLTAGIIGGVAGGAAASFVASGGNLQATVQGAFTGALFGAAGFVGGPGVEGANSFARYAAHAGAGCLGAAASGGDCGSGAASAVFGKFATNNVNFGNAVANGVAATIAGGVGSVIAGGKFENGATTAAFGYLFNYCMSGADCWRQTQEQIGKLSTRIGDAFREVAWALTPGSGAVDCLTQGCSLAGAALAAVDFVPGGKAAGAAGKFFEGAVYTDKVLKQMSNARDLGHSFPLSVDGVAAQAGQVTKFTGGDGATYFKLQAEGTLNGTKGVYEYIKNATGEINHRFFEKAR